MTVSDISRASGPGWRMPGGVPGGMSVTALRYGASAAGLAAVSAAHFFASLILLHALPVPEFGLISFVMVMVAFGISVNVSLILVPITRSLATGETATAPACFQMNWLVCSGFAILLFAALLAGSAPFPQALLLALYAALFIFRWFARSLAFADGRTAAAIQSDILYSALLAAGLGSLAVLHRVTFSLGSGMLLLAALMALLPFGAKFFRTQIAALRGNPKRYGPIFRDVTRWSLTGVALTELTVNAHAYLVTFISGPGAFALLALGMLLMRPAALMQQALPDLERPQMARAIAAGSRARLSRIAHHFTLGLACAWGANLLLGAGLLIFLPGLVVKQSYDLENVILATAICGVIMLIRALRTPQAVLLQAAGEFRKLARIGAVSAIVSLTATLSLLLILGPIASLGGIVLGELVILAGCTAGARAWTRRP